MTSWLRAAPSPNLESLVMLAEGTELGEWGMFTTRLNLVVPFAFAVLGVIAASIEPSLAQPKVVAPAPLIGAGLPAFAILGGGYWLIRRFRRPR
jgi:hypothetical protein